MSDQERERGTTLKEIRTDHKARYDWARKQLARASHERDIIVADLFCGNGYGAALLCSGPARVEYHGYDRCHEAIEEGRRFFNPDNQATFHPHEFDPLDGPDGWPGDRSYYDVVVSFESIEHVRQPDALASAVRRMLKPGGAWLVSVPNQEFAPWNAERWPHHHRHYTPGELRSFLKENGFKACMFVQNNRFIVAMRPDLEMTPMHLVAFAVKS